MNIFPYQKEGIKWLESKNNCILADEPGMGKTLQVLQSIEKNKRILIVSPSHLQFNWAKEIKKWRKDIKPILLKNGKSFKYPDVNEAVIISYGLLPWWLDLPPNKRKNPMMTKEEILILNETVLIFDEVHELKNNKAIKTRRAKQLVKYAQKTIGMTGTPILNRPLEFWNICNSINVHKDIFHSFFDFVYLFNGRKTKYGYEFGQPKSEIKDRIKSVLLRRTKSEVSIQLPKKFYIDIRVEVPNNIKERLDNAWQFYQNQKAKTKEELPDFTEISKEKEELSISKINSTIKLIEQFEKQNKPVLVFTAHTTPVDIISKRKGWAGIQGNVPKAKRDKIVENFQAGKLKGIVATIKAAGTGLTLTKTNVVIFNDLDWVPANNLQAENRAARIGQNELSVDIYHIVANHPLERHMRKVILDKMNLSHSVIEKSATKDKTDEEIQKEVLVKYFKKWKKENDEIKIISNYVLSTLKLSASEINTLSAVK